MALKNPLMAARAMTSTAAAMRMYSAMEMPSWRRWRVASWARQTSRSSRMRSRWWPRVSWAMAGTSLTWMGLAGGQAQQGDAGRPQDDQEEGGQDEGGDGDDHGHLGSVPRLPAAPAGGVP